MSQYLTYNGYTHDPDACWFTINRVGILGQTHRLNKVRNIWTINGRVSDVTAAAVDAKVVAWEASVRDGGDLVFSLGTTARLMNSDCVSGTHVKDFKWLPGYDGVHGSGAEGILRRTFSMTVWGDILVATDTDIIFWKETIAFLGTGGSEVIPVTSLTGSVQAQTIATYTPIIILQSGSARGLTATPAPSTPMFLGSATYSSKKNRLEYDSPTDFGVNQNTGFGVRWSYYCWTGTAVTQAPPVFPF